MEKKRAVYPALIIAAAVVLLFVAGVVIVRTTGGVGATAYFQPCMKDFSSEQFKTREQEEAFYAYVTSRDFIVTILQRDEKYAPLIPRLGSFWKPGAANGRFYNGDGDGMETPFPEEYQDTLDQLRVDVYTELDVQLKKHGWGR